MNDKMTLDHPELDNLIEELRELKRFIEDDAAVIPDLLRNRSDTKFDNSKDESKDNLIETIRQSKSAQSDGLPRLDDVIVRTERVKHQMDLLSDAIPQTQSATTVNSSQPTSIIEEDARTPTPVITPSEQMAPNTDNTPPASSAVESKDADEQEGDDANLTEFVYDLADRIIQSLDDKLMSRTGEELPDDLRREFRETVADILYEWT
ncbi:MAG: hypothetical protein ACI8P9_000547 [Parasphingorhabdus sp.]